MGHIVTRSAVWGGERILICKNLRYISCWIIRLQIEIYTVIVCLFTRRNYIIYIYIYSLEREARELETRRPWLPMFGRNAAMPRSAFDAWMTILPYKSHVRVHVPPDTRTCSNREEREHWVPTLPPPGTPLLVGEPLRRICSCHCEQKANWFHSLANRYATVRMIRISIDWLGAC